MHERTPRPECRYCGAEIEAPGACAKCADLPALDAEQNGGGPPLTDAQLGVPAPYRVPKRAGRRELY